jgi:hypothetical protein
MCRASVISADWHIQICRFYAILQHFDIPFVALPRDPPISLLRSLAPQIELMLSCLLVKAKLHKSEYKLKSIQHALETRLENFNSTPSKMIDSILNRTKKTIILDRCLDNSSTARDLLTSESEVKKESARHFQMAAGSTHSDVSLGEEWSPFYQPVQYINNNIYHDLMVTPTADEWYTVVQSLPNEKAPGPSKISNEMLKHLDPITRKAPKTESVKNRTACSDRFKSHTSLSPKILKN